ncbi:MAG: GspH/FimT family pseudopilin [Magnetococcales bacterium]|nr:GspH/FimT family pseudopilin [Magnetococcales bacterium]
MPTNVKSCGFTLIELVLIIVIVGILTVIVSAKWPGEAIALQSYRENLAADINLARSMAISRSETITIKNSTINGSYTIVDSQGLQLIYHVPFNGVTINSFNIEFDSYGNPGESDYDVTLVSEENSTALRIVGVSGMVQFL